MAADKTRLRWWCLIVTSTAVVITGLQNTITNVALPSLTQLYRASSTMSQWFVNSYILTFASMLLLMGFVGDTYGRKRTMNVGLLLFMGGSVGAALSRTAELFVVTQVIMGAGAAMLVPQTLSILVDTFPREERAQAIAIWTGVAGLGSGLGPLIGGFLLQRFPVSSVFTINIPLVLVSLALGYFVVFESRDEQAPALDVLGAVYSAIAIVAITFSFISAPVFGWTSAPVAGAFVAGSVCLLLFVRHENKLQDPLLQLAYFKDRRFLNGVIGISAVFFALMGMMFLVTQFLQIVREWSALRAGLAMLPMALMLALGSILSGKLSDRLGVTQVIVIGVAGTGVTMALLQFWSLETPPSVIAGSLALFGVSVGLAMGPGTNEIMSPIPADKSGQGSSINTLARQVSGAIGIAILGSVLNSRYAAGLKNVVPYLPSPVTDPISGDQSEAIRDSVAQVYDVAATLTAQGSEMTGVLLRTLTAHSFTSAMSSAFIVGAVACVIAAVYVGRRSPPRGQAAESAYPER